MDKVHLKAHMSDLSTVMAKLSGVRKVLAAAMNENVSRRRSGGEVQTRTNFAPDQVQHHFTQAASYLAKLKELLPDLYGDFQEIESKPTMTMVAGNEHLVPPVHFSRPQLERLVRDIDQIFEIRDREALTPEWRALADSIDSDGQSRSAGEPAQAVQLSVFLCHASEDKAAVRTLRTMIEQWGHDPWLDEEKLLPGQDWDREIRRAVERADVVIVCLSSRSEKQGYVQKEIKRALDVADEQPEGSIFLIPVKLNECSVPDRLSKWHWVDLSIGGGASKLEAALKLRAAERASRGSGGPTAR